MGPGMRSKKQKTLQVSIRSAKLRPNFRLMGSQRVFRWLGIIFFNVQKQYPIDPGCPPTRSPKR